MADAMTPDPFPSELVEAAAKALAAEIGWDRASASYGWWVGDDFIWTGAASVDAVIPKPVLVLAAVLPPVGPVAALDYAEKLLLGDEAVEAASRTYEPSTWEGLDAGRGRDYERRDALDDARVALRAAFREARERA